MVAHDSTLKHQRITADLRKYQALSLVRGAAALTIWPPNDDRIIALDQLSEAVLSSSVPSSTNKDADPITVSGWREWLQSRSSTMLRKVEPDGIYPGPSMIQSVVGRQRHELIGGFLDAPDLMVPIWVNALSQVRNETKDGSLDVPLCVLLAAVAISDRISRHAELGHYRWPDHTLRGEIGVPTARVYRDLVQALTFTRGERDQLWPAIAPLLLEDRIETAWRPLIPWRAGFIVARPAQLLLSALVRAVEGSAHSPLLPRVVEAVISASVAVIKRAATDMDWRVLGEDKGRVYLEVDRGFRAVTQLCVLPPTPGDFDEMQEADSALGTTFRDLAELDEERSHEAAFALVLDSGRPWSYRQPLGDQARQAPLVMRLGEFRLLGDAFRRDPLGLVRALELVPPPPWPRGNSLVDIIGTARVLDDAEPEPASPDARFDGVEYLHRRSRVMAMRHPAPAPDGRGWVDVSRWQASADDSAFTAEDKFEGDPVLVRNGGSFIWLAPTGPNLGPHHITRAVCRIAAFWIARLRDAGWSIAYDAEYAVRVTLAHDRDSREKLTMTSRPGGAAIRFGRGFVEMLCRPDNDGERLLLETLVRWWWSEMPAETIARLVDAVAPAGRGTLILWPDPDVEENDLPVLPPEPVTARERREIERHVTTLIVGEHSDAIGAMVGEEHAEEVLRGMVDVLVDLIEELLDGLGEDALLDLVRINERAAFHDEAEAISMPARASMDNAELYFGPMEPPGECGLAIRGLIEWLSARRPTGTEPLSLRTELRLRAAASLLVRWGAALEALMTKLATVRIGFSYEYGIAVAVDGPIPAGTDAAVDQLMAGAPDLMAARHSNWWDENEARTSEPDLTTPLEFGDALWVAVDQSMAAEWGFSYDKALRLLRATGDLADTEQDLLVAIERTDLVELLQARTEIDASSITQFIEHFTLPAGVQYDPWAKEQRLWETNRASSYIQRPFVGLGHGRIAFTQQHTLTSMHFLDRLIEQGRLRLNGRTWPAVRQLSLRLDRDFEVWLERRCQTLGLQTALRVKRLGGRPIEVVRGESLGDIDVLAWSADDRRVFLLDAKRISPGLPPLAILRQAEELVDVARKHRRRLDWVLSHRAELKRHTKGEVDPSWDVQAALVLENALPAAGVLALEVPAWPVWELAARVDKAARVSPIIPAA